MSHRMIMTALLTISMTACSGDASEETANTAAAATQTNACDLLGKEQVEQATGLVINNVVFKDRGAFSTCNFETDRWEETIGLIYFQGLGTPDSATSLTEQLRTDLERDGVPYTNLVEDNRIGDAAASYQTDEGNLYTVVAQRGGHRVIISARSREAASAMASAALSATK